MLFYFVADIEAQILDIQQKKKELAQTQSDKGVSLLEGGYFDSELYDDTGDKRNRYDGYMTSIAANDDVDDDEDDGLPIPQKRTSYTAPKAVLKDIVKQVNIIFCDCSNSLPTATYCGVAGLFY